MTKITGESKDIVTERLEQLKALVPEAFGADGKIDFDALKGALGEAVDSSKEHYRFTWNGKEEARAFALRPSMGTLRPCIEESSGKDGTAGKFDSDNLYIEGDNLEVLKLLQGSYHNAVKMIYIDPPYNTGHDFVYADDFSDSIKNYKEQTGQSDGEGKATHANAETSGRYHTDWLNMMFPRLLLARNLLRDDGVIFISIDDNEVTNLRKLCDEVFGESNHVTQLVWKSKSGGANDSGLVAVDHEYVLMYAKSAQQCALNLIGYTDELTSLYTGRDEYFKDRGPYRPMLLQQKGLSYSASLTYPIKAPDGTILVPESGGAIWRWSEEKFNKGMAEGFVEFKQVNGLWKVYTKQYLCVDYDGNRVERGKLLRSVVADIDGRLGTRLLQRLFAEKVFTNSKPLELLKLFASVGMSKDDIILDFFSGSATTAHAVSQLNTEDGGRRKCILVQLPEACEAGSEAAKAGFKNICEIGKERIRRAGKKIKEEVKRKSEKGSGAVQDELKLGNGDGASAPLALPDIGFKVFKLDTSNIIPWNPNPEDLKASLLAAVNNAVEGRTVDDILYEILLKCNLPLTLPIEKKTFGENTICVVGEGALMICLDKKITAAVAEEMVRLWDEVYKPEVAMQVVFLDNGFTDKEKANAIAALVQAGVEEKAIHTL